MQTTRGSRRPVQAHRAVWLPLLLVSIASPAASQSVFPGASWATRTPSEVGLDGAKLDQFAASVGGDGVIIKDGYLVKAWGDPTSKADWGSVAKPVTSTMLLFAIKEGMLSGLDALVRDYWKDGSGNDLLIAKDRTMTFRHLSDMTSGYARGESPGAAWAYNDYASKLYSVTLFDKVFNEGPPNTAATQPTRLGALQFQDGSIYSSREGYGVSTSPRDLARIGWFWLNRGNWNGQQLLPQSYFDSYFAPGVPGALPRTQTAGSDYLGVGTHGGGSDQTPYGPGIYGFNSWYNDTVGTSGNRTWPDAPADVFQANGHWGIEAMTVFPSLQMVVAARGNWGSFEPGNASSSMNQNLKLLADAAIGGTGSKSLGNLGTFHKWHKVEVTLAGPSTGVTSPPNPFTIPVDVTFTGPGATMTVPAFYDGDGAGGSNGNVWKVRFSPDAIGSWSFTSSSPEPALAGYSGSFNVVAPPPSAPDYLRWGRLVYVGGHYLKFRDGGSWLKGGIDDPENFLGSAFGDWAGKKSAIDAVNARGVNSIYAMSNTIDGDRNDTWPWWGASTSEAKANSSRYDVGKLRLWEDFFTYCESKGVTVHFILNDDSAWHSYDHDLYYREMVARFGHHPAIIWNLGEEVNEIYTDSEQVTNASRLQSIDPYDHPITVHRTASTSVNWPFLGDANFALTSIQPGDGALDFTTAPIPDLNQIVRNHRTASEASGRPIPIMIDETPNVTSVTTATRLKMRSQVLYPIYLGGGNYELHYQNAYGGGGSVTLEVLAPMLDDMRHARDFMQSLPLAQMAPHNALLSSTNGNFCLADPGSAYGIYLANGGLVNLDLRAESGTFTVTWYNVTTGATTPGDTLSGGDWRPLGTPPTSGDVALRVVANTITGVGEQQPAPPGVAPTLSAPAPNPSVRGAAIAFNLPSSARVMLAVYDAAGRLVRSLADRSFPAGVHSVSWDGLTAGGGKASSGVYFFRLRVNGSDVGGRKMVVVR